MLMFAVISNYFDTGMFGIYSSIKRARLALEHYFHEEPDIISFEDIDNYTYRFFTRNGETFSAEIAFDPLDYEFVSNEIKEED